MKKYLSIFLGVLLFLSMSACGTSDTDSSSAAAPSADTEAAVAAAHTYTGEWHLSEDEADDISAIETAPVIRIWEDGTFVAYEADGTEHARGYVVSDSEEIEGTRIDWVILYTEDDEEYLGFVDQGEENPTDFYVGNGAYPHYKLAE